MQACKSSCFTQAETRGRKHRSIVRFRMKLTLCLQHWGWDWSTGYTRKMVSLCCLITDLTVYYWYYYQSERKRKMWLTIPLQPWFTHPHQPHRAQSLRSDLNIGPRHLPIRPDRTPNLTSLTRSFLAVSPALPKTEALNPGRNYRVLVRQAGETIDWRLVIRAHAWKLGAHCASSSPLGLLPIDILLVARAGVQVSTARVGTVGYR